MTAINAHGETEALELRGSKSTVANSFMGLVGPDIAFLVRILIVETYTFDLEEDKSKLGLDGRSIITLLSRWGDPDQETLSVNHRS